MIVVVFVEKHWSSSRRLLLSVGRGVGADDGMMVGWGVGAAVGTSDGIDEDGIDEGALVGSPVDSAVGGALVTKFALTEADDLKVPKTGPLVWAVISAGIAYACLK